MRSATLPATRPNGTDLVVALDAFEPIETTATHVRRALQVQRLLAERSQRGRKYLTFSLPPQLRSFGIPVLHYDGDFDLIADVTGQSAEWVVPAGDAD